MKKRRRLIALGVIVVGAAALARLLDAAGSLTGLEQFEDFTLDLRQQTSAESFQGDVDDRDSEIVLVLFDEFSVMDPVDGWDWISPFPRANLAELVDALAGAGAKTIGIDVFLDREYPGLNEIDHGDDLLQSAIERAGNVILVTPVEQTDSGPVMSPPHPRFADVAAGVGSAELPSSFETFRDGTLLVRSGTGIEPSFALALYAHSRGLDLDSLLADARRNGRLSLPGLPPSVGEIPAGWLDGTSDATGSIVPFRIRYVGPPSSADAEAPPGTFPAFASGTVPTLALIAPEYFRDKIVLMGTGFHPEDRFRTPFYSYRPLPQPDAADKGPPEQYGWMYGVEVHANSLQNILDGEYVKPMGAAARFLLLLLVALVAGGVAVQKGTVWGAAATAGALVAVAAYAWWAWYGAVYVPGAQLFSFGERFKWIPVGAPIVSGIIAYGSGIAYVAIVEGRQKRFFRGAFGKYVSPDVVNEIAENPEALKLGGQKAPVTLLFSDLSGFTTLSEHMDPEDLIALLNEYLDDMTEIVLEERGYLDKYIGDAIMAFWNKPVEAPDHADRAMRTAIRMQRHMSELNRRWHEADPAHVSLKVRIGVHTGEVVVGNVGGEERFSYTGIGDAVNLAARLEPANKTYQTLNMVSETTLQAGNPHHYRVRELDTIAVKGKERPVRVYELIELAGTALEPDREEALRHFERGMAAYKAYDWATAKQHFQAGVAACPSDGPCRVYVERCDENLADPPPPNWDFVVRRTEK